MTIAWTKNTPTYLSGVSAETDMIYELKRGDSDRPLWWASEMEAGRAPRSLTGLDNLDVAKAYCGRRDQL